MQQEADRYRIYGLSFLVAAFLLVVWRHLYGEPLWVCGWLIAAGGGVGWIFAALHSYSRLSEAHAERAAVAHTELESLRRHKHRLEEEVVERAKAAAALQKEVAELRKKSKGYSSVKISEP